MVKEIIFAGMGKNDIGEIVSIGGTENWNQIDGSHYRCLTALLDQGYTALFMPEVTGLMLLLEKVRLRFYTTPSIRAVGETKGGNVVDIYAHVPNFYSNPENIEAAIKKGLQNHATELPQEEFSRLLDKEDHDRVYVIDHTKARSGEIRIAKAMEHPHFVPFIGSEEAAEKLLDMWSIVFGKQIPIWCDDFYVPGKAMATLLVIGARIGSGCMCYGSESGCGLDAGSSLIGSGARYIGVKSKAGLCIDRILESLPEEPFTDLKRIRD